MRGEVYLTGLSAANRLRVNWRGQSCEFDVAMRIAARDSPGRIAPPRSCLPASA
jgi:outer membrane usher protein FimD/PapC